MIRTAIPGLDCVSFMKEIRYMFNRIHTCSSYSLLIYVLVELISNVTGTPESPKIFAYSDWKAVDGWLEMSYDMILTQDTYMRIRGESSNPPDKWFYSNSIRVVSVGPVEREVPEQ